MKTSIAVKSLLASICHSTSWVAHKLRALSKGDCLILMYHRVIPRSEAQGGVQAGMYVAPETLANHIVFLKEYFSFCPLSRPQTGAGNGPSSSTSRPHCVLTFDDGWSDFYRYAFPILKSHQVPATVFLPTDYIGSTNWFWTDRLASILYQNVQRGNRPLMKRNAPGTLANLVAGLKGTFTARLETAIEQLKSLPYGEIERVIEQLSSTWGIDPDLRDRAFLTWDEVREMLRSGLVTFGSHTAGHRILTSLGHREIEEELKKSKEMLLFENVVDPSFIPFCYPNGNYSEEIARMVRDAGYALAVTTKRGWNHAGSDLFTLRRVGMHQDVASTQAMFGCRIVGLF